MKENLFDQIKNFTPKKKSIKYKLPDLNIFQPEDQWKAKNSDFVIHPGLKSSRTFLILFVITLVSLFFIARAYVMQVIQADKGVELSDQNRRRNLMLQPERGVIYDRNGEFIVRNKPAFSLDLSTGLCSLSGPGKAGCKILVDELSLLIPLNKKRIYEEIDAGKSTIILVTGLNKEQILPLETKIKSYPGVSVVTTPQRDYMYKNTFAHVLGYVGIGGSEIPSIEGKMGVENSYDRYIAGSFGSRIVEVDASGNLLDTVFEKQPIPGKNVTLFIDLPLQKKAYELAKQIVDDKKAKGVAIVAQDPQTGGILALISYPSFDPDQLSSGITSQELEKLNSDPGFPFYDRVVSAAFPPGSTFKMVTASAALAEKVVTPDTIVNDPGYIQVGSYIFRNWKLEGHGEVNLNRALQVSNDTYFYTVGGGHGNIKGLGIEKLSKWAKRFGFGSKTGIDIPGEVAGYMPDGTSRDWYLGDTFITSIGQGDVLSTPLQLNNYVCYFANGGKLLKPQVVREIEGEMEYQPQVLAQNLIDEKTLETVRAGMKSAVEAGGTGYPVFDFPIKHKGIELGGKTGTSEYITPEGEPATHAWFTVFGPFENASITLTVFLEGGGSGSDDAGPVARQLLDVWFKDFEGPASTLN